MNLATYHANQSAAEKDFQENVDTLQEDIDFILATIKPQLIETYRAVYFSDEYASHPDMDVELPCLDTIEPLSRSDYEPEYWEEVDYSVGSFIMEALVDANLPFEENLVDTLSEAVNATYGI